MLHEWQLDQIHNRLVLQVRIAELVRHCTTLPPDKMSVICFCWDIMRPRHAVTGQDELRAT